jgi:hypothetical protein
MDSSALLLQILQLFSLSAKVARESQAPFLYIYTSESGITFYREAAARVTHIAYIHCSHAVLWLRYEFYMRHRDPPRLALFDFCG